MRCCWLRLASHTGTTKSPGRAVLADPPAGGMASPGGEFLGRVDQVGVPVDVAVRLVVRSRAEGLRRNKRVFTALTDQVDQVEASDTSASSRRLCRKPPGSLVEYNQRLSLDPREVEVEPVVMLSCHRPDGELVDDLCLEFQQHPANKDFSGRARSAPRTPSSGRCSPAVDLPRSCATTATSCPPPTSAALRR